MTERIERSTLSRRDVLKASPGAVGLLGIGSARADEGPKQGDSGDCPDGSVEPSMIHYDHSSGDCADDHPKTKELKAAVASTLEERLPTVGSLVEAGYVPYFDYASAEGAGAWSHWINPEYLGDDSVVDPDRPASVMVDHQWWRPLGAMFVASRNGDRVDPPPTVYETEDEGTCSPWHTHVGLPARYSWWKYKKLSAKDGGSSGEGLPCRTPWVMHVWAYPHPQSVYAHGAPPVGNRGGPPAEDAGFETDAVPGEDDLGPDVFPDIVRHRLANRV